MSKLSAVRAAMFTQTERPFSTTEFVMPAMPAQQKIKPLTDMFSMQAYRGGGYQWIVSAAEYNNSEGGTFVYFLDEDAAQIKISAHIPILIIGFNSITGECIYDEDEIKLYWSGGRAAEKTMFRYIRVTSANMTAQSGEVDIETPIEAATPELLYDRLATVGTVAVDGLLDGFELIASISGYTAPSQPATFFYRLRISYNGNITSLTRISMPGDGSLYTIDNEHLIRIKGSYQISEGVFSPVQAWIIDARTLAVKASKTFHDMSGYSAGGIFSTGIPQGATRPRRTAYEKDLYGRRIVAAVEIAEQMPTTYPDRTVVWLEDAGSTSITEVELTVANVQHIIGTNRAGDICYYSWPKDADLDFATINLQRVDGSLAWSHTYTEWVDAGWGQEWWALTKFISRRGEARTTAADEISFRYAEDSSAAPYMSIVLDDATGFPKSSSKATYLLPTIGGNLLSNITVFDQYDPVTDTVQQRNLLLNTYSKISGSPADRAADKFRNITYNTIYNTGIRIINGSTGTPMPNANAAIKVNGNPAWPMWDYDRQAYFFEVNNPGDSIEVTVRSRGFQTKRQTYTFVVGDPIKEIIIYPIIWERKSYEIYTPQDLFDVREDAVGNYKLMNDIDMAGFPWEPMFTSSDDPFMGTVDGQGYAILNFNYNEEGSSTTSSYSSIFGKSINAQFRDIELKNCNVFAQSGSAVSILVASVEYAEVYLEDPPSDYERVFPKFENIKASGCHVASKYGASNAAIICGEFYVNYPYDPNVEVFVNCHAPQNQLQGIEWAGSYYTYGGVLGYASINAPII